MRVMRTKAVGGCSYQPAGVGEVWWLDYQEGQSAATLSHPLLRGVTLTERCGHRVPASVGLTVLLFM